MRVVFDIGGSRVRAARSPQPGVVDMIEEWPTQLASFATFADRLEQAAAGARDIALSLAGVIDADSGVARVANIACLDGRRIKSDLESRLGCRVHVANDADCFALAEAKSGAGRGHRVVFGVILGTGTGGGLVVDGQLHQGAGGYAGEWGHGPALRDGIVPALTCGCGLTGCLDTLANARGLERLDRHLGGTGRDSRAILTAWAAGEALAERTVALWVDLVSGPLAMVLNVLGPSVVPVGGGLSNNPALVAALDKAVRARILRRAGGPLLVPAHHRIEPGLIGASFLEMGAHG